MTQTRREFAAALAGVCLGAARAQAGDLPAIPAIHQAQIEARLLAAPQAVTGSDGKRHFAYELRITSFQADDNPLTLTRLAVFADAAKLPLTVVEGSRLSGLLNQSVPEGAPGDGIRIESGRTATLFLWLTLPAGRGPGRLSHQLSFLTAKGEIQRADGVQTAIAATPPIRIGAPLRAGRWLAVEGPGNARSHHWGSLVAVDGTLSIPQRFAIDWFGLDDGNHSLLSRHEDLASSVDEDWVGYGKDVLAVAEGVVIDARNGIANGKPLNPLEGPDDLTARTLYGNFVVLKIAPGVYAHYAHLQAGSVLVRAGQRVRRGEVVARLGQTGSAGAPHLHFHLSNLPTFEHSQGLPFVIDAFTLHGQGNIEESFDPTRTAGPAATKATLRRNEMPLDGNVVTFP